MNTASIKDAFISAMRGILLAFSHPFLILFLWLSQMLIAWMMIEPIALQLSRSLDHSVLRDTLANGFDLAWLREWLAQLGAFVQGISFYQKALLVAFLAARYYLSGGIFSALWLGRLSPYQFFYACSNRFLGQLLLLLPMTLMFVLFVPLPLWLLSWSVQGMHTIGLSVHACFWVFWLGFAFVAIFMFSAVYRVYEYSRLLYCAPGSFAGPAKNPLICFWRAFVFCVRHHVPTFLIVSGFALLHPLLIWAFAKGQNWMLPEETRFWWIFGAGQVLVLARIITSLGAHGAHLALLRRLGLEKKAAAPPTATPEIAPPDDSSKVNWSSGAAVAPDPKPAPSSWQAFDLDDTAHKDHAP